MQLNMRGLGVSKSVELADVVAICLDHLGSQGFTQLGQTAEVRQAAWKRGVFTPVAEEPRARSIA